MRKNMHKPPKRSNFAIRKLTIGAAAVLLVGPLIGARTQNA
ncbi:MAG: YSIRK-type signal peptide-containing protein [Lactobacillus sp.]